MRLPVEFGPVELRPLERLRVLRIRHDLRVPAVAGELGDPTFRSGATELRLGVRGEELPRRRRAPLLAHEEHRRRRTQHGEHGGDREPLWREGCGQPITDRAVADLVVVLREGDETPRLGVVGEGHPVHALPERRPRAGVEEAVGRDGAERGERREVGVVPGRLAGERDVHRVVVVVAPLGREPVPALGARTEHDGVVEVGLRDERQGAIEPLGELVGLPREGGQDVLARGVPQGVDGVEAQTVDAVLLEPHPCVVEDVAAHLGLVEVHLGAPRVGPLLAEVGPEQRQVVAARPEVVVDDILDDAEPPLVAGRDETRIRVGAAVRLLHREPGHPVVAPVPLAVEGVHGQQFDEGDAEVDEVPESRDRGVERPLGGERADVQLVDDAVGERTSLPVAHVGGVRRERLAESVDAVGKPSAARVGSRHRVAVEQEAVPRAVGELRARPPAARGPSHRPHLAVDLDAHPLHEGSPDAHGHPSVRRSSATG